jgi:thiamine-monophosphate kinase
MQAVKVGCNLYEDKLPLLINNVCENYIDSTTVAINGGEDYELLFTIAWNLKKGKT